MLEFLVGSIVGLTLSMWIVSSVVVLRVLKVNADLSLQNKILHREDASLIDSVRALQALRQKKQEVAASGHVPTAKDKMKKEFTGVSMTAGSGSR